jgi:glycine/D-amino acid oxidase-like deaminating enzyme
VATDLPARATAVIVGGGVIGCSVAYHLTKMGLGEIEYQYDAAGPLHG